jgi:nucleotide-binding universal stress UspA family protein
MTTEVPMRIICAVDGSEYSDQGVQTLQALAGWEPEHVALVHVIDKGSFLKGKRSTTAVDRGALKAMEKAGQLMLRNAERSARIALGQARTGPSTSLHRILVYGPLAATIVQEARRLKADLILMGSRGLSDIKGFLLGSTSRRVASTAPCSVLVVKERLSAFSRVTLAVDDSRPSRAAARFLRSHMLSESTAVTILSSAESPVSDLAARYVSASQIAALMQPVIERTTRLVDSFRDDFIKEGWTATTMVKMDHVIDTIIKHVEADHTDLLVVGSRPLTKSERLHLGSVSESLLRHAPCSVLIARGARA